MSNFGGPSNLFGGGGGSGVSGGGASPGQSYAPNLGLRQRHNVVHQTTSNKNGNIDNENAHPNNNPLRNANINNNSNTRYGKWGSMSNVRAPPRMSLANAGGTKFNRNVARSATGTTTNNINRPQQQQQRQVANNIEKRSNIINPPKESAIVPVNENNESKYNKIITEADIYLYDDEGMDDNNNNDEYIIKSTLDNICGKILGWFFMWDTSHTY